MPESLARLAAITKHGLAHNPIYKTWHGMIRRCTNPEDPSYFKYGARGITVCSEWMDITQFYRDMGDRPSVKHTIDRIDGSGNYEPSNCRWATPQQQNRNRSNSHYVTFKDRTLTLAEWAEVLGLTKYALYSRVKHGWDTERMLTQPLRSNRRRA